MELPKTLNSSESLERNQSSSTSIELPKHYLPNFSFRLNYGPTSNQFTELGHIHFPGCTGVYYTPPFLVLSWKELPMKPWPLTVGGSPLYYAKQLNSDNPTNNPLMPPPSMLFTMPPTVGRAGGSAPMMNEAADKLNPWVYPGNLHIKRIAQHLLEQGIGLIFLGWSGWRWYAEVASAEDSAKLPVTICKMFSIWKVYPDTALARLQLHMIDSIFFIDGDEVNEIELEGCVDSMKNNVGSSFYLDSPCNEKCEGIIVSKGIRILPAKSQNKLCSYFVYFGNGTTDIILGTLVRECSLNYGE